MDLITSLKMHAGGESFLSLARRHDLLVLNIITLSSFQERQGAAADKLQVKAAAILPFVGLARSKKEQMHEASI